MKAPKRSKRRGRMLLAVSAGAAGAMSFFGACGVTIHGTVVENCDAGECGPNGVVALPDGGEDAGVDGGQPDASGPFGIGVSPDAGEDGGQPDGGPFGIAVSPDGGDAG